jgi:hypothetical protein
MTTITIDADSTTSNAHGCAPIDRTLEALLEAGMLVIDKPAGPNSHQVSAWARDLLGVDKLGHGGTLDPFATGVLVLLAGRSMRLTKKVLAHDKTYVCVLRAPRAFDADALERAITQLSGQVYNVPPEISAVKVQVRSRNMVNRLLGVDGRAPMCVPSPATSGCFWAIPSNSKNCAEPVRADSLNTTSSACRNSPTPCGCGERREKRRRFERSSHRLNHWSQTFPLSSSRMAPPPRSPMAPHSTGRASSRSHLTSRVETRCG